MKDKAGVNSRRPHPGVRRVAVGAWWADAGTDPPSGFFRGVALVLLTTLLLFGTPGTAKAQVYEYRDASIRRVITDVEATTEYHFLYRDALVSGKTVTFAADAAGLLDALEDALKPLGVAVRVDTRRRQVMLAGVPVGEAPSRVLPGYAVDDRTGMRLPYATVSWTVDGRLRGVAAGESGAFHVPFDTFESGGDALELTVSYVGYEPRRVRLEAGGMPSELAVRLVPDDVFTPEVVVTSAALQTDLDTTWHHLVQPGLLSSLGEQSVVRSLQVLPAVTVSPAVSPGLVVRGSRADGFQVLLDGVPIYNQSHLFGLFDAFNEDALQTVGLYYGNSPARFQGPPGGTLAFVTRTGSQTSPRAVAGLSSTSAKGSLEGPLFGGAGSWFVSGRRSFIDAVDWLGNEDLVTLGLDVDRPLGAPAQRRAAMLTPAAPSARFWDLHAKVYRESEGGRRIMVSTYLGGDQAHQSADRIMVADGGPDGDRFGGGMPTFAMRRAETSSDWGNRSGSIQDQRPLGRSSSVYTLAAFSRYYGRFAKDDFAYLHAGPGRPGVPQVDLGIFSQSNDLLDMTLHQRVDAAPHFGGVVTAGYDLHHYRITYEEVSALQPSFAEQMRSTQIDLFAEIQGEPLRAVELRAGLRSHTFSRGGFLRLSPRLSARVFPRRRVSIGFGFSRNHQFLHRLSLEHTGSPDVWVAAAEDEPPGSVTNVTAGLYVNAHRTLLLQAEVYAKSFDNLRLHATSVLPQGTPNAGPVTGPWLHDNTADARGLELMARHSLGRLIWTNSYALARMEIRHPALRGGTSFRAPWDRTHQLTSQLQADLGHGVSAHVTWLYTSGTPNALANLGADEPETLPAYHRLDAAVTYRRAFRGAALEARASVFNLYDRRNTWYRTPILVPVRDQGMHPREVETTTVDVYDLGLHPSFELALHF